MEITAKVDVTQYEPRRKHPVIFETFDSLEVGQVMEISNDHDPRPLQYQFMMERPQAFEWQYLEEGPELWRVAITRTA